MWRSSKRFLINTRQRTAETNCDITVAQPAPATPIPSTTIINISRAMFRRLEIIRKTTGVFESPSERINPDRILYRNVTGILNKIV